jgi:hypothetical protein
MEMSSFCFHQHKIIFLKSTLQNFCCKNIGGVFEPNSNNHGPKNLKRKKIRRAVFDFDVLYITLISGGNSGTFHSTRKKYKNFWIENQCLLQNNISALLIKEIVDIDFLKSNLASVVKQ